MDPYYENQRFNKWWMKLIFIIPIAIVFYGIISGKTPADQRTAVLISGVIAVLVGLLFLYAKLETRIDSDGITMRYFPFQRVYYYVRWTEIEKAFVRKYRPLAEYGGWGLRYGFGNGKAFTVSGSVGFQLVLKNGKKILIGTQQESTLKEFLEHLRKDHSIGCIEKAV